MDTGEVDVRTRAALDLASTYVFGTEPGPIPAVLFEAYDAATADRDRALLAAALARCWAYAGRHDRAAPFAAAAVRHADATGDPAVRADALDAALATHWGPDELAVRTELAGKLSDVAAHLADVDARTTAHLWLLTVATESLDILELNRQMRALERLGEQSRRSLFFAATRRLMVDLMRGRMDTVDALLALASETADELPDGQIALSAVMCHAAAQAGRSTPEVLERLRAGEELAEREGIREVYAEIAWIHLGLGRPDDARRLVAAFDEGVLTRLPRDHNYLLVLQLLLDVALRAGVDDLVAAITPLLLPHAGRAVVNSGALMFHGVTDDTLARACDRLGDAERATALRAKALDTYRRIGATWWRARLEAVPFRSAPSLPTSNAVMSLRPGPAGTWLVGRNGDETAIPARRGLEHLHTLLSRPGVEVSALDLVGGAGTIQQAGLGEVADAQALAAYRRRLGEIDAELDGADASGDAFRGERLAVERAALLAELSAATGLGGRPRVTGSSAERARVTARKAISAALDAIHVADPVVARHLATYVHTGLRCSYKPDPEQPVAWHLTVS